MFRPLTTIVVTGSGNFELYGLVFSHPPFALPATATALASSALPNNSAFIVHPPARCGEC